MFDSLTDSFFLRFLLAAISVAIALGAFFGAVHYIRRTRPGTFLGASRPRQARLQVLDQVPVDARRRLVLIRRDNVEHLLLIGGPQDLVIEQDMGKRPAALPAPSAAVMREEEFSDAAEDDIWRDASAENFDFADEDTVDDYYHDVEPALEQPKKAGLLGRLKLDRLSLRKPQQMPMEAIEPEQNEPRISARFSEWEEDEDEFDQGVQTQLAATQRHTEFAELEEESVRLRGEPPTGTIRPLSAKITERPVVMPAAPPPEPQLTPEEAAIARELEAARRRAQIPAPNAATREAAPQVSSAREIPAQTQQARPLPPVPAPESQPTPAPQQIGPSDFDRVLEREMQEKLEAAKRPAPAGQPVIQVARVPQATPQQQAVGLQPARPVVQQARRDPPLQRVAVQQPGSSAMQSGIAQIFGEDAVNQQQRQ